MKTKKILLSALCLMLLASACQKDNSKTTVPVAKTPVAKTPSNQSLISTQALAGQWFVVKDSIQTVDLNKLLPAMRNLSYSNSDYVVFNSDNSGTISSQNAFNALYTNYPGQFVSDFNQGTPNLNFNYQASTSDNTLSIPKISSNVGIGYNVTMLSATSMLLYTESIIVDSPHQYTFKQYIYLSK